MNNVRLIDANALSRKWQDVLDEKADEKGSVAYITFELFIERLKCEPTIDPESLRPKGQWELTAHSFYRDTFDESCELCVYIVANCSECSGNHPNSYQVFSKTLYAPEDADEDFRFDQNAEENKAMQEFQNRNYSFAHYCPNCGAKMEG